MQTYREKEWWKAVRPWGLCSSFFTSGEAGIGTVHQKTCVGCQGII